METVLLNIVATSSFCRDERAFRPPLLYNSETFFTVFPELARTTVLQALLSSFDELRSKHLSAGLDLRAHS